MQSRRDSEVLDKSLEDEIEMGNVKEDASVGDNRRQRLF